MFIRKQITRGNETIVKGQVIVVCFNPHIVASDVVLLLQGKYNLGKYTQKQNSRFSFEVVKKKMKHKLSSGDK